MAPVEASRASRILSALDAAYPDPKCALNYRTPFELLVASILSAQCTDERVNQVTPDLFRRYPDAHALAGAGQPEIEEAVRPTGFFRQKARTLHACCREIVKQFAGEVPPTLEELITLPGVGRKTANLVLGEAFSVPGIVVDTHVRRVAARIGFTNSKDPDRIEQDLMIIIPKDRWTRFSHQLIRHGRTICAARKPRCEMCLILPDCDYGRNAVKI
ncbi:MAG: endonuclease III [Deltaproteobacteria bacterium]|nr:endonuclease III [Deltaproteobacteria bacterium]MBW2306467.1 endonuclease III [Deltaproteobacteria bacterium]